METVKLTVKLINPRDDGPTAEIEKLPDGKLKVTLMSPLEEDVIPESFLFEWLEGRVDW